jgi:Conjugal transfer protein TraD
VSLPKQIKKQEQLIARYENQLAYEKIKQRKLETRRKIEFGGLVIKSGMSEWDKAAILGALLHATAALEKEPHYEALFKSLGETAFREHT